MIDSTKVIALECYKLETHYCCFWCWKRNIYIYHKMLTAVQDTRWRWGQWAGSLTHLMFLLMEKVQQWTRLLQVCSDHTVLGFLLIKHKTADLKALDWIVSSFRLVNTPSGVLCEMWPQLERKWIKRPGFHSTHCTFIQKKGKKICQSLFSANWRGLYL